MTQPTYLDGEPTNLEGAALDALEWLRYWQRCRYPFTDSERMDRAIEALDAFLPDKEPVFEEMPKAPLFDAVTELAISPLFEASPPAA